MWFRRKKQQGQHQVVVSEEGFPSDRRRHTRRRLMTSSELILRPGIGGVVKGQMLNVSADGVAALVPGDGIHGLNRGARLLLEFSLGEAQIHFEMEATIRSLIPTAEGGRYIVGIELFYTPSRAHVRESLIAVLSTDSNLEDE